MKHALIAFFTLFTFAGFVHAQTAAMAQPARVKIPILTYHSIRPYYPGITSLVKEYTVPPDIFDAQLKYMKDHGFTAITPDDVVSHFIIGRMLPAKPYMITFDDGWKSQMVYALPVLQKYNVPAVFYIYKNAIGGKVFMTWSDVQTLLQAGMVIGDHTESHPLLTSIRSDAGLQQEIVVSKKYIEDRIGRPIDTFAYPFGAYNDQTLRVVKQAGFTSARALHGCVYQSSNMLLELCGVIVPGDFNQFVYIVNKP